MRFWKARLTNKRIVEELRKHIDTNQYGIGYVLMHLTKKLHILPLTHHFFCSLMKFIEIRKGMGLFQTRQQGHTPESIQDAMLELRAMYPNAGAREMISLLFHEMNMAVSRSVRISILD